MPTAGFLRTCRTCGQIQVVPPTGPAEVAACRRCATAFPDLSRPSLTLPAALAALVVYPVAMGLPVLSLSRFGLTSSTDIWHGALRLLQAGHVAIGLVVVLCSVIVPPLKLLGLIGLSLAPLGWRDRHRALTWRLIDAIGRWGMVDVLLVAIVVAAVKLGDLVQVSPGPGAALFALMVALSLVASATFEPERCWPPAPWSTDG